jgi:3-oxoacyl-(acyl-carrier-protein) synthase
MKAYINGVGVISPQGTWLDDPSHGHPLSYSGDSINAIEPEYTNWIPPQVSRRMSRIMKMGITAALMALKDAGIVTPHAIVTGTGYGALEDTATFLTKISDLNEDALNPTPFMQSTHNTIGSAIALFLQCTGYNQTYVHSALSFEHALLDAQMLLQEHPDQNILAGGVDEWTAVSHAIQARFNKYRKSSRQSLSLFEDYQAGTIAGEGAVYFSLTSQKTSTSSAVVERVKTYQDQLTSDHINAFLKDHNCSAADIDLVITGKSGDSRYDSIIDQTVTLAFSGNSTATFKHLCGEYSTASAFALALSARIFQSDVVPDIMGLHRSDINNIVIYNSYLNSAHSLMLVKRC